MPNARTLLLIPLVLAALAAGAHAAQPKTYQVTGPVVSVTPDTIVVKKGKDNWELGRDASTKAPADLKVGDTVTVQYRMTATDVEAKPAKTSKQK
jgi:hypothetical protein